MCVCCELPCGVRHASSRPSARLPRIHFDHLRLPSAIDSWIAAGLSAIVPALVGWPFPLSITARWLDLAWLYHITVYVAVGGGGGWGVRGWRCTAGAQAVHDPAGVASVGEDRGLSRAHCLGCALLAPHMRQDPHTGRRADRGSGRQEARCRMENTCNCVSCSDGLCPTAMHCAAWLPRLPSPQTAFGRPRAPSQRVKEAARLPISSTQGCFTGVLPAMIAA